MKPVEIRQQVEASIGRHEKSPSAFSWPDDGVGNQPWYYAMHCAWIKDWDAENRSTDSVTFLRNWMTDDNLTKIQGEK